MATHTNVGLLGPTVSSLVVYTALFIALFSVNAIAVDSQAIPPEEPKHIPKLPQQEMEVSLSKRLKKARVLEEDTSPQDNNDSSDAQDTAQAPASSGATVAAKKGNKPNNSSGQSGGSTDTSDSRQPGLLERVTGIRLLGL